MSERRRRRGEAGGAGASHRRRYRAWSLARLAGASYLAAVLLLVLAAPALAQEVEITSDGPLTRIIVTSDLNCQVAHRDDLSLEFFGTDIGACGTFLAVEGTLFGPSVVPAASSSLESTPWTVVSQTAVAGSGSSGDPLRVVTVADAGATGLRVEQTDSYVVGSQSYRTDVRISNQGAVGRAGIVYRAGDCFLQESDVGFGRVDSGAPACVISPEEGSRIEQWLPVTPGSHYMEGGFTDVWAAVGAQQLLPDTCACDESVDNGAGLSWPVDIPAGQSVVVSHDTFFSPVGRAPAQESLISSVPDPTKISLDPVIVVQSVAIAAGVMLLIPFPSAIFNSTLEEHYDEVMAGVARIRARMAAFGAWIVAQIRRQVAARRRPAPSDGPPEPTVAPEPTLTPEPPALTPEPTPTLLPTGDQTPSPAAAAAPPTMADQRAPRDLWRTPQGMALFVLASALVYAFVDPTFGFSLTSVATFVGLAIGLAIVTLAYGVPLLIYARTHGIRVLVRALPATILVGVGCVIVSRLADFQPGYVYGLIIGFLFATKVGAEQEGRGEALAGAVTLAAAVIAWFSLAAIRAGGADSGDLGAVALQTAAVTVVVAGMEGAVFAMLPLRFLPGGAVYAWNRRVWLVLIGLGVFGFAHILLNPQTGYIADETRTSFLTMVILLLGFGLVSVLFWAWFRFRPARRPASE